MPKGEVFPAEWLSFADPETGVEIRQLTNHKGHSHHLYFTNPGWYDGGRRLLFGSDRNNRTNLFGVALHSGEITQLTDLDQPPPPAETSFLFASVNPTREEAYFWQGRELLALDLGSLGERKLYEAPEGFMTNMTNVSADGRHVCALVFEDLSDRFGVDLLHGYIGFEEYWAARPLSRIVRVDTESGAAETVFEEEYWIGHTNTSPTLPNLLTFCHEGPWHRVDNRIWGLDLDSGSAWKIRPGPEGEAVGHEYWLSDGVRIGYHGTGLDGEHFYGSIRHDDTDRVEAPFPHGSTHFHSNDLSLIVHVRPRFSPDADEIPFASDASGYGNLHLVDALDFDSLPEE